MSDIVLAGKLGQVSSVLANAGSNDELSAGIGQSFGVVSYKGKVWAVKFQGNETKIMRDDGDGPRNSIEVVVLKSANTISKIWYENGYVDGSTAPPDCWSTNGQTPDPASPKKQSATCAGCRRNAWGSKVTEAGKAGKECADSKRLAIVPLEDIDNDIFNGPMLLRVPAASLRDIATYANQLNSVGYPYFGVGTRISFDANEAYPKFVFGAIRALNDAEAAKVLALRDDERVKRILNVAVENVSHEPEKPAPTVDTLFEQAPAPKVEPKAEAPKPKPVVKAKAPEPVWVEAELEDGTAVLYNEATGEWKPIEAPKPKPVVKVKKAEPAAEVTEDSNDGVSPIAFDELLSKLTKED